MNGGATGDVMCRRIDKIRNSPRLKIGSSRRFIINSLRFAFKQHFGSADDGERDEDDLFTTFFFVFSPLA